MKGPGTFGSCSISFGVPSGLTKYLLQLPSTGEGHEPEPPIVPHGSEEVIACPHEVDDVPVLIEEVGGVFLGMEGDLNVVGDVHARACKCAEVRDDLRWAGGDLETQK